MAGVAEGVEGMTLGKVVSLPTTFTSSQAGQETVPMRVSKGTFHSSSKLDYSNQLDHHIVCFNIVLFKNTQEVEKDAFF